MDQQGINLLSTKPTLSADNVQLLARLKLASYVSIALFVGMGILVAVAFFAGNRQIQTLETAKAETLRAISAQARTEVLLGMLKERTPLVGRLLENQMDWNRAMSSLSFVVDPTTLKELTIDPQQAFTFTVQVASPQELSLLTNKLIELVKDRKIKDPHIKSLSLRVDGSVDVIFSFVALL